jgi:hypothetical protein
VICFGPTLVHSICPRTITLYLVGRAKFEVNSWCKGSVAERIFAPVVARIKAAGGRVLVGDGVIKLDVADGHRIQSVKCECVVPYPLPGRTISRRAS